MRLNLGKYLSFERNPKNGGGLFVIANGKQAAKATRPALYALARQVLLGTYLPMNCPSCGRRRLEWNERGEIVCEICGANHSGTDGEEAPC